MAAGLGGGSADAAALLRLAGDEVDGVAELAVDLGADVPSQLDPAFALVGGAGEMVEPLPPPGEFAAVLVPAEEGLRTADVYAEADRLGLGRDLDELDAIAAKLRAAAAGGASPLEYFELLVNDLGQAALSMRPEIGASLTTLRDAGAAVTLVAGSGPTAFGLFEDIVVCRSGRRGAAASLRERDRGGARGQPMSANGDERRSHFPLLIVVALAIGGFVVLNRVLPDISLQQALQDVSSSLGDLTYVLVGLGAFLETGAFVGLVLPGETVVILGGAVAGQGETSIVLTIGVVWAAALAGDSVSFLLGRRLGREFLLRHGPKLRITPERFASVESYFARHGGKTIVIGRFIGLVRALAPFIAGSSGMRYGYYLPFSVLGTGLWAATFGLIGYFASQSLDAAAHAAGRGTLLFGIAVGVIVGIVVGDPLPAPAREPRAAGGRDGATRRPSSAARGGAAVGATGALPVGPADARGAGTRVHDPARRPRRQPLRGGRLHGGRLGRPGADAGRSHGVRCRRSPARGLGHRRRQDRHRARLRRRQRAAGGPCGAAPGVAAALGRGRRAGCGSGDHLHRGGGAQGRD